MLIKLLFVLFVLFSNNEGGNGQKNKAGTVSADKINKNTQKQLPWQKNKKKPWQDRQKARFAKGQQWQAKQSTALTTSPATQQAGQRNRTWQGRRSVTAPVSNSTYPSNHKTNSWARKKSWQGRQSATVTQANTIAAPNKNHQAKPKKQGWRDNSKQPKVANTPNQHKASSEPRQWQSAKHTAPATQSQANSHQKNRAWQDKRGAISVSNAHPNYRANSAPRNSRPQQNKQGAVTAQTNTTVPGRSVSLAPAKKKDWRNKPSVIANAALNRRVNLSRSKKGNWQDRQIANSAPARAQAGSKQNIAWQDRQKTNFSRAPFAQHHTNSASRQKPWQDRQKARFAKGQQWQAKQGTALTTSPATQQAGQRNRTWQDRRSVTAPVSNSTYPSNHKTNSWARKKSWRNRNKFYINTGTPQKAAGLALRPHPNFQSVTIPMKKRVKKRSAWLIYRVKKVLQLNAKRATRRAQIVKKSRFKNTDTWLRSLTYKDILEATNRLLVILGRKLKTKNKLRVVLGLKSISAAYISFKKGLKKVRRIKRRNRAISNLKLLPASFFLNEIFRARVQTALNSISKPKQPKRLLVVKNGRVMPGRSRPINKLVNKKTQLRKGINKLHQKYFNRKKMLRKWKFRLRVKDRPASEFNYREYWNKKKNGWYNNQKKNKKTSSAY